jgi:tRNA A37 threonylcarbamoyladenosine modification protein TsaB
MNLFIDWVSSNWVLILFDDNRQIVSRQNINILANESSKLNSVLDSFLDNNRQKYTDLDNIVVINWPWSFTWIRAIVLIVNTINFITKKNITPIWYFDLFKNYPIVKSSSKRDLFVKFDKSDKIEVLTNEDFINKINSLNIKSAYWDLTNNNIVDLKIESNIDYDEIIKNIELKDYKIIEPLYLKRPNIS